MQTSNVQRALRARHPLDELRIRSIVYRVCTPPMSSNDIETLWEQYSVDVYEAQWIEVDDAELDSFEKWLRQ
jgi:hypothetical protein